MNDKLFAQMKVIATDAWQDMIAGAFNLDNPWNSFFSDDATNQGREVLLLLCHLFGEGSVKLALVQATLEEVEDEDTGDLVTTPFDELRAVLQGPDTDSVSLGLLRQLMDDLEVK